MYAHTRTCTRVHTHVCAHTLAGWFRPRTPSQRCALPKPMGANYTTRTAPGGAPPARATWPCPWRPARLRGPALWALAVPAGEKAVGPTVSPLSAQNHTKRNAPLVWERQSSRVVLWLQRGQCDAGPSLNLGADSSHRSGLAFALLSEPGVSTTHSPSRLIIRFALSSLITIIIQYTRQFNYISRYSDIIISYSCHLDPKITTVCFL